MIYDDDCLTDLYWDGIEELAESKLEHNLYVVDIVYENKENNKHIEDSYECYYKHDSQAKEYALNLFEKLKHDDFEAREGFVPVDFIVSKCLGTEFGQNVFEEIY